MFTDPRRAVAKVAFPNFIVSFWGPIYLAQHSGQQACTSLVIVDFTENWGLLELV